VSGGTRGRTGMMTTKRASSRTILSRTISAWLFAVAFDLSLLAKIAGRSDTLESTPFLRTRRQLIQWCGHVDDQCDVP
jgi:hypothetical protein